MVESSRGAVLAELRSDDGVGRIAAEAAPDARAEAFRQTLARRVHELSEQAARDLIGLPVLISGMASSSIGWRELPYAQLPFAFRVLSPAEVDTLSARGQARLWQVVDQRSVGERQRLVFLRLVRAALIVKASERRSDVVEMLLPEKQKVVG